MRPLASCLALCALTLTAACAMPPDGPRFRPMTEPRTQESLLYIYRTDALRGVGSVDIRLDGEKLGKLKNREYLALLVDPGRHELAVRLRWLGLIPRSWNSTAFTTGGGQTVYVKTWAATQETPSIGGAPEAPGRADRGADVVMLIRVRTEADVGGEIERTRKARGR